LTQGRRAGKEVCHVERGIAQVHSAADVLPVGLFGC
jgi:hypothetical protein